MINGYLLRRKVFVDKGEGGAVHLVACPQDLAQGLDEGGFTRSHLPVKGNHARISGML